MFAAFSLLAAAGPLAAQSPSPQPQPPATPASQPPERKAAGERTLNLKLDDASRHRIMSGSIEERPGGGAPLPSLGGDARRIDPALPRGPSSPYPKQAADGLPD